MMGSWPHTPLGVIGEGTSLIEDNILNPYVENYQVPSYPGGSWPALTDFDLHAIMQKINKPVEIFMRDSPGLKTSKAKYIIINLDDSNNSGTHWTALYDDIYFDSYGLPPPEEIKHRVKVYSNTQYQPNDSVMCGYYCVVFLTDLSRSPHGRDGPNHNAAQSLYNFTFQFDPYPSENNDKIIMEKYKQLTH